MSSVACAMGGHQSARAACDVWLTPPAILAALGGADSFTLDPCAAPAPRPWPTARRHNTAADGDGLALHWQGRVWLNPPYSRDVGAWLAKLADHGIGTALVFARTETAWFAQHVWTRADAILFLAGRLHFHRSDGSRAADNAGAPSCLVAYGRRDADLLAGAELDGALVAWTAAT